MTLPATAKFLTGANNAWQGTQDNQTREETFYWMCPWADSNAFYNAVVGQMTTINYGTASPQASINRRVPLQHPFNANLYATKLSWQGQDGPHKPAGAPYAWIKFGVTFGYLGYSVTGGEEQGQEDSTPTDYPPFMRITGKSSSRTITDTSKKYQYATPLPNGGTSTLNWTNQNIATIFGGISYQITLFCIPNLANWQTIMDPLKGCVNSHDLVLGAFTQPKGTVLLEGYGFEQDTDVMGNLRWTGTIDLICSSLLWNNIFIKGKSYPLSPPSYPTADLNQIYY